MSVRSKSLLCIATLTLLTGCSTAASSKGLPSAAPRTAAAAATTSASAPTTSIKALVAEYEPQVKKATSFVPLGRGDTPYDVSIITQPSVQCPRTGDVSDLIGNTAVNAQASAKKTPDPAKAAEAYLEGKGWRFDAWTPDAGPTASIGGDEHTTSATRNGVYMYIDYQAAVVAVVAYLPCLPGKRILIGQPFS